MAIKNELYSSLWASCDKLRRRPGKRRIHTLQIIVAALAAQYGADRIYLFGSYARGDADEDSDIDLRIDKGAIRGLQLGGLAADLEDALGIPVDLIPTGSLDSKFLNSISDDEVLLYEAS